MTVFKTSITQSADFIDRIYLSSFTVHNDITTNKNGTSKSYKRV